MGSVQPLPVTGEPTMLLPWIIGFCLRGSSGAIAGAAAMLLFPVAVRRRMVPALVSYATGTLLGAAFLGMLPVALSLAPAHAVTSAVLFGIVAFFILEKLVLWRHCYEDDCPTHGRAAPLILFGDALHNFVDGVVIAAAFLTSIPLGIATALAVIAHEIPQEVGDFGILLDCGYGRGRALWLNTLSSLATVPGAIVAYLWLGTVRQAVPYILAVSAASFIYIATADLIPGLHRQVTARASLQQLALLLGGIATIAFFKLGA